MPVPSPRVLEIRCEHGVQVFADAHECLPCTKAELAKYRDAYIEERTANERVCELIVAADADTTRNRRKRMTEAAEQALDVARSHGRASS